MEDVDWGEEGEVENKMKMQLFGRGISREITEEGGRLEEAERKNTLPKNNSLLFDYYELHTTRI